MNVSPPSAAEPLRPRCSQLENMSQDLVLLFEVLDSRPHEPAACALFLKSPLTHDKILLSRLSHEELEMYALKVVKLVASLDKRVVKRDGYDNSKEGKKLRFKCNQAGKPSIKGTVVRERTSNKVGCPWKVRFNTSLCVFEWDVQPHHDACKEVDTSKQDLPEGFVAAAVNDVAQRITANPGLTPSDHFKDVHSLFIQAYVVANPSQPAPTRLNNLVLREARKIVYGDVKSDETLGALIGEVDKLGKCFKFALI